MQAGDTLSIIADRQGVAGGWRALYAANTDVIENPALIYVGEQLRLPGSAAPTSAPSGGSYIVQAGDTLSVIADREGVAGGWRALYEANTDMVENPALIYVGEQLRLP